MSVSIVEPSILLVPYISGLSPNDLQVGEGVLHPGCASYYLDIFQLKLRMLGNLDPDPPDTGQAVLTLGYSGTGLNFPKS